MTPPHGDAAIATRDLRREFAGTAAVAGLDLRVATGEVYGFLGPNGAGKSTTVRMLCTLTAPTAGTATVAGHDVVTQAERVRSAIGVALQDVALDPRQTGVELLRLQGRLYGLRRQDVDRRLRELTDLIDLGDALDRRIGTYSGGMRRRLDLAAALVHQPRVLFLDEPTTGLDPVSRATVWEEVRGLNRDLGVTIFLTTQYLEEADALADRVGIIDRGGLVAQGTPAELKRRIGTDLVVARIDGNARGVPTDALEQIDGVHGVEVRDGQVVVQAIDGAAAVGRVAVALADAGVDLHDLTLRTPTLDDVFVELTGSRLADEAEAAAHDHPTTTERQEVPA